MERQSMTMDRAVQVTYFLLRIVAGLLFVQTGGLILFGWFGGIPRQPGPIRFGSRSSIAEWLREQFLLRQLSAAGVKSEFR